MPGSARLTRVALTAALLAALCQGQTAAEADKTAAVEGQVNHGLTGEPMVRAHVVMRGSAAGVQKQYGAMTTAEGKFSMTGVTPGNYQVNVEKTGFVSPPGSGSRVTLLLKESDRKDGVKLKLIPTGAIAGRVTDAEGEPVEGATVVAEGGVTESVASNETGNFRIGGLTPGKYRVKASLNNMLPFAPEIRTDGTQESHYVSTYYPGVLSSKEAALVEVRTDGESGGADIRLMRLPWVRVSGRVLGLPEGVGNPVVFARQSKGFGIMVTAPIKQDGSFEIWRSDPGKYMLSANFRGGANRFERTAEKEVEVGGANVDGIELRVIPESDLPGRVDFEDDAARQLLQPPSPATKPQQPGTQPSGQQRTPQPSIQLQNVAMGPGPGLATFDESGIFSLKKVAAGRYRVVIRPDSLYVRSMRLGSRSVEGSLLDLSDGSDGADLSILVSAKVGSISGAVVDSQGSAPGTRVVLEPEKADAPGTRRYATAGQDGTYQFRNLAPGTYKVVAVQDSDTDSVMQMSGLDLYDDLMETVEIQPGDNVTKDLRRRAPGER
ncbi:MAG: carboxypeptidase-like regulatory domain-containing protein [Acidobacteriota bacterium]